MTPLPGKIHGMQGRPTRFSRTPRNVRFTDQFGRAGLEGVAAGLSAGEAFATFSGKCSATSSRAAIAYDRMSFAARICAMIWNSNLEQAGSVAETEIPIPSLAECNPSREQVAAKGSPAEDLANLHNGPGQVRLAESLFILPSSALSARCRSASNDPQHSLDNLLRVHGRVRQ